MRIHIGGKTILERVLARLKPQCTAVILNANGQASRNAGGRRPRSALSRLRRCSVDCRRYPGRRRWGGHGLNTRHSLVTQTDDARRLGIHQMNGRRRYVTCLIVRVARSDATRTHTDPSFWPLAILIVEAP
jgi:hypothetical protein